MKYINQINNWLGKVEAFFISTLLLTMIFLAFLQVVMRGLFNTGLPWADSVVRLMVLWLGLIGAALATRLEQNLTMEVLTKYIGETAKNYASVLVKLFAIFVCCCLVSASLRFLADERSAGEIFYHVFPSWYTVSIIPIGFSLIAFHLFVSILNSVEVFFRRKQS